MHAPIHTRRYVKDLVSQDRLNEAGYTRQTNFTTSVGQQARRPSPLVPTTWAEGIFFRHPLLKSGPRISSIGPLSISMVGADNFSKAATVSDYVSFQKSLSTAPAQIKAISALRTLPASTSTGLLAQMTSVAQRDPQIPSRLSPIARPAKRLRKGLDKTQPESDDITSISISQKRPKTTISFKLDSELSRRSQQPRLQAPTLNVPICRTVLSTSIGARSSSAKRTLAIWLVDYIVGEFVIPNSPGVSGISPKARRPANSRIFDFIVDCCPPIEATVLSLWYLSRLFPTAFIQGDGIHEQHLVDITLRLVIIGFMFANKWFQDYNLRHTHWSRLSRLSLNYLSVSERLALGILDYNISISEPEWAFWLSRLLDQPTSSTSVQPPALEPDMRGCISRLLVLSSGCRGKSPFRQKRPIDRPPPTASVDALCNHLITGLSSIKVAKPAPSLVVARTSAPWNPLADPPVPKPYVPINQPMGCLPAQLFGSVFDLIPFVPAPPLLPPASYPISALIATR